MAVTTLKIEGMSCEGCVRSVKTVLEALPGVERAEVSLALAQAEVRFDPGRVTPQALREAVEGAGYHSAG
jgi:copper chaperone